MGFVDSKASGLLWPRVLKLVPLGRRRIPEYRIICRRNRQVLGHIFDPSWKAICTLAIWQSKRNLMCVSENCTCFRGISHLIYIMRCTNLDFGFVGDCHISIIGWNNDFENAKLVLLHRMGLSVPVVYTSRKYIPQPVSKLRRLLKSPIR